MVRLLANTLYKPCILCTVVIVSYAQNLWCCFSDAHILCTIFNTPTVFLKSFFCRGGDKEADRRRKIRCLHIHSRVDGGRGLLTVLAVGGGKGMLIVCLHLNMHRRLEARRCCLSFYPFSILFIYDLISALL